MAAATASPTSFSAKEFAAMQKRVDSLEKSRADYGPRLDAATELMNALKAPASRAGVTPQELIYKATQGGKVNGVFSPDGIFAPARPLPANHRRAKGIGMGE